MKENYVSLSVADGINMDAYTSFPKQGTGPFPGIILFQEAFGVNHHIRNVADRLASQGYVVIAPELFHRTGTGLDLSYNDFPAVIPHMNVLTVASLEADAKASFNWLQQQNAVIKNKIGSIGFCMGGKVSFIANMSLPLQAAVSYYAGRMPAIADRLHEIHAPQLMFWGGLDKHITPEQVDTVVKAMQDANKEFINVTISYADHAFNCDERPSFHPQAAKEAWALTLAFFESKLK